MARWLVCALGLFLFSVPAYSQSATLRGTVTDQFGAVIGQACDFITREFAKA